MDKEIGCVTIYSARGLENSQESALVWYTKSLLWGMSREERQKLVVFSNIKNKKQTFTDGEIEINECWNRGGYRFPRQIIAEIDKYPGLKVIHIQHEFNLFGGLPSTFLYLFLLKKLKKDKKIIVTYHAVILPKDIDKQFKEINQLNFPASLIKFAFGVIYKLSARYIDKVIVHENYFKKILVENYGFRENQIEVFHMGIEDKRLTLSKLEARERLGIPGDKRIVLFLGFLARYKGINLLLDTFRLLDSEQYYLILAGGKPKRTAEDANYKKWYSAIEGEIKRMPNVLRVDFVPDEQIELYFSASDVLVSPYLQLFGPSGPISLAISHEKPFLASDVFMGIYENDQVFFERNKESLRSAIENFFGKKDFLREYIRKMKTERSWNIIGQQTYALYQEYLYEKTTSP